jgi:hypothetical protein
MRSFVTDIAAVDVSAYPDVHAYEDETDALLWVLKVAGDSGVAATLTAAQAAELLVEVFRRDMTRQRAASLLRGARALVAEKIVGKQTTYMLLKKGADRLLLNGGGVLVVEPSQAFTALQRFDGILASLKGEVLLCDPYVNDKTLTQLATIPVACRIKLLTLNVSDPSQFRGKLQAYVRQYGNLDVRVDGAGTIHDRYLIDDFTLWSLGTSLSGIGKKQSLIVKLGEDLRAVMKPSFMARWNTAKVWA